MTTKIVYNNYNDCKVSSQTSNSLPHIFVDEIIHHSKPDVYIWKYNNFKFVLTKLHREIQCLKESQISTI